MFYYTDIYYVAAIDQYLVQSPGSEKSNLFSRGFLIRVKFAIFDFKTHKK